MPLWFVATRNHSWCVYLDVVWRQKSGLHSHSKSAYCLLTGWGREREGFRQDADCVPQSKFLIACNAGVFRRGWGGGGGGFGGESCFTTCVMPCPSSLPLLLRKIRESYRVEWQPPSQGSLLPVLGTRLNGVGVRATDRRSPSPRLSPRPLGLAPTPPRFGIQQKEFT